MPRIARVVAVNYPHHVIQRGNRRQKVFFQGEDYKEYLALLQEYSKRFKLKALAYCLMPNHVHLIVTPKEQNSLTYAIAETHRNYTRYINFREKWRGYLWQGRFISYILDEVYLLAAVRYILLNPVKTGIVKKAWDYKWSSAKYYLNKENDNLIEGKLLNDLISNWRDFLSVEVSQEEAELIKTHEKTGRPLGSNNFIEKLEKLLNRELKRKKPGPKSDREEQ